MKSLEELLQAAPNPVEYLRNSQSGPNVYPGVPPEYTNWRDETQAWRKACVLFNLSFHMADLYVEGPDATKLLSHLAINTFKNVSPGRAKQFVPVSHDGGVIGDVILFNSAADKYVLVGRIPALNWVTYHAQAGKYDVKLELDERSAARKDPFNRKQYRFQIQGPNAMKAMEKVLGGKVPEVKFFHVTPLTIAGKRVTALRHGMAGQPGFELVGPYAEGDAVRDALVKAGEEFGLRLVGGRAYSANTLDSGWIPSPLPAIYSGDKMKPYRQWLKEDSYEARASIGGSLASKKIEDYYLSPWDMGYGSFVDFEHDFIGREALQKMSKQAHRRKVTLALENDDVLKVIASQLQKSGRGKFMELPSAVYSMHPYDKVTAGGNTVGISTWIGYSANEGRVLTIAVLDAEHAESGTEVTLVWGEEGGGTSKPTVEPHVQMEIRAIVSPVPYAETARKVYADGKGWRAAVPTA